MKMYACRDLNTLMQKLRVFQAADLPILGDDGVWRSQEPGCQLFSVRTDTMRQLLIPGLPDLDPGDGPVEVRFSVEVVGEGSAQASLHQGRQIALDALNKANSELQEERQREAESMSDLSATLGHEQPEGTLDAEELAEVINVLVPLGRYSIEYHDAHEALRAHIASELARIETAEKAARKDERERIMNTFHLEYDPECLSDWTLAGIARVVNEEDPAP